MNVQNLARTAYTTTTKTTRTARGNEYEAFMRISSELKRAALNKKLNYGAYVEALHKNRKLWTVIASDVASDNNQLPRALRGQIFSLSRFVFDHTSKILRKEADEEALLEINRSIMRGLQGNGGQQ